MNQSPPAVGFNIDSSGGIPSALDASTAADPIVG